MTEAAPSIHQALSAAMADIGAVGKDARNEQQGFNFRSADAIVNEVGPAFRRHGIIALPRVDETVFDDVAVGQRGAMWHRARLKVTYRFCGPAGDHLEATVWGEGVDPGDKCVNKALTAAWKYALAQTLAIPTGDREADHDHVEEAVAAWEADRLASIRLRLHSLPYDIQDKALAKAKRAFQGEVNDPSDTPSTWADWWESMLTKAEAAAQDSSSRNVATGTGSD